MTNRAGPGCCRGRIGRSGFDQGKSGPICRGNSHGREKALVASKMSWCGGPGRLGWCVVDDGVVGAKSFAGAWKDFEFHAIDIN